MPPKENTDPSTPGKGGGPHPTGKQLDLMLAIVQNCHGKLPDLNWDEVAANAGYKTAASAREVYRVMAKKLGWGTGGTSSPTPKGKNNTSAGPTPTKVQKNTGKVGSSSAKKGGGGGRGRPMKKHEDDDDDADENDDTKEEEEDSRQEDIKKYLIKTKPDDGMELSKARTIGDDEWDGDV